MGTKVRIPLNPTEQVMIRLMRAGDRLWRASDERFGKWGLTDNHYNVLRILNGAGEALSQVEIGRRMLSSRANVTKLIDLLEEKKYVRRLPCGDRRINLVELTAEGADFLQESLVEVLGFAQEAMKPFSRQELKTLATLLKKLAD